MLIFLWKIYVHVLIHYAYFPPPSASGGTLIMKENIKFGISAMTKMYKVAYK